MEPVRRRLGIRSYVLTQNRLIVVIACNTSGRTPNGFGSNRVEVIPEDPNKAVLIV